MAKAQLMARFAVEVEPSSILIRRRRAPLARVLDTIAEDEKEAAAAVELSSSYALLRTRAPRRRNLSYTATEVGKPSVRGDGERCPVAGSLLPPHAEELAVLA
ncbi:uncharacterized protein LOC120684009 [Panicum virgatum]|uniref:Uncharacterized protein n=1 Tax=Panicum virgatum TaxID=38727 RepID=A0A8T0Q6C8_PANVG|nr:uncharacterized protein LOC120684009 [Panicum virgatum]KAG2568895.1 hypothetical protein PVAP13_7NG361000 [Panicum virgatum]